MREHVKADEPFVREDVSAAAALERFKGEGQDYKVELIEDLVANNGVDSVSLYTNGPFTDLCRGPHAPSTDRIKAFKLLSVAGAYWRGDSDSTMLTRIYGTPSTRRTTSTRTSSGSSRRAQRDHRKLGRELGLFALLRARARQRVLAAARHRGLQRARRAARAEMSLARGYEEVKTPMLYDRKLWEISGHWDKYRENMFVTEAEDRPMGLKPMNCPAHCAVLRDGQALLPRAADPLLPSRALCTATSRAARCTGCCASATSSRTTRTSSAPRSRSRTRSPAASSSASPSTTCSASSCGSSSRRGRRSASAPTRCGTAPRPRSRRRSKRGGSSTRSTRATARSTGRRSTCT